VQATATRYTGARNNTTQQSEQTPDKELEIKNISVYVSGYTETDTAGTLSPPNISTNKCKAEYGGNGEETGGCDKEADEEIPILTFYITVSSSEVVRRHFSTRSKIQV
jgi:hypothetical protein